MSYKFDFSRLNWVNTLFLIVTPLVILVALPLHLIEVGWSWPLVMMFLFACLLTSMSITGGYHRLFSHRSYEARLPLKILYLIFGAAAAQNSALKWSRDHRRHHRYVDSESDPYNIRRGFWYAHMGWIFFKEVPTQTEERVTDLENDPWVMWQDKYYAPLVVGVGFLIPTLIGWAFGYPWGGLLYGGFARVVVTHHCTFFINSLCHLWGHQPYGDKTSARDNFVLAFFTYGEGYHNFHHRFEADYRNGIRWYQWDPTKWLIQLSALVGMTKNLRKVSDAEILRARLAADEKKLVSVGIYNERFQEIRRRIEESQKRMAQFRLRYNELKKDFSEQRDMKIQEIKTELRLARIELEASLEQWRLLCRQSLEMASV